MYEIKHAKDVQALKVVSQNLMHSYLSITDGIYEVLSEQDLRKQIASLGEKNANNESLDLSDQVRTLEASVNQLKKIIGV